ncbi:uncharacterized protein N7482_008989 [Penicillium canariense]|uniref:DUF7053 domain-containing protein n=1 Tax=Penicillium canariense TaxID=189055 RepID=A0A9W9LIV4_9EURO|nr:uncharacterized protein N7482_008989 [Penicillium canariense]KAJ5157889.1 hypothetical protein N7482_008989 [Penicillium canariense]
MQSRTVFTSRTPLPASVSEEAVLRTLRDHAAMIEQNPLVIHYERCAPPADAPPEESNGVWYELTDRISYLPWGLLRGKVRYRGCFHDTPQGLRTHIYAPLGVHIRNHWTVGRGPGNPTQMQGRIIPMECTCRKRLNCAAHSERRVSCAGRSRRRTGN